MPWSEADPQGWPWITEILLPVMKGEYRGQEDARKHAAEIGGTAVQEDSPEERKLLHPAAGEGST